VQKIAVLLFAFALAILLMSCEGKDSPTGLAVTPPAAVPAPLAKYWQIESVTVNGVETPFWEALNRNVNTYIEVWRLASWGVYTIHDFDPSGEQLHGESGAVSADEGTVTFTVKNEDGQVLDPPRQRSGLWAADGTAMELTIKEKGKVVVIRFSLMDYYNYWDLF
jgi:hypothetical protein